METSMTSNLFKTTNRRLEQYLFMNSIPYIQIDKAEDGMTRWSYERTPDLNECLILYKKAQMRRRTIREEQRRLQ